MRHLDDVGIEMRSLCTAWLLVPVLLSACAHQTPNAAAPGAPLSLSSAIWGSAAVPVSLRSFSEAYPFTSIAVYEGRIYVGTPDHGVGAFDLGSGNYEEVEGVEGIIGQRVIAQASHPQSGLWILTESGLARLDHGMWSTVSTTGPCTNATVLAATPQRLWVGGENGLCRLDQSHWEHLIPGARIRVLVADVGGNGVWLGTEREGVYQITDTTAVSHSSRVGQRVRKVRAIVQTADGGVLVGGFGVDTELLALSYGGGWDSYALPAGMRVTWLARSGIKTLVGMGNAVYALNRADQSRRTPTDLPRDTIMLEPLGGPPSGPPAPNLRLWLTPERPWLTTQVTAVTQHGSEAFLGTATTGALRLDGQRRVWYRTREVKPVGPKLAMACSKGTCFVAGEDGRAFRIQGDSVAEMTVGGNPAPRSLGFFQSSTLGPIALLSSSEKDLQLWAIEKERLTFLMKFPLAIPGTPLVRFVREDGGGRLWVGLGYIDQQNDERTWGIAVLDSTMSGRHPIYHRTSLLPAEKRQPESLALPDDVRDVFFNGDEVWVATSAGICRVKKRNVDVFGENQGLPSEIIYDVDRDLANEVTVATVEGLGSWIGERWVFDSRSPVGNGSRSLYRTPQALLVGTVDGLVALTAAGVIRFTESEGLAGATVRDFALLEDTLWVLTDDGLTAIWRPQLPASDAAAQAAASN